MRLQVQFEVVLNVAQSETGWWLSYVRRVIKEMGHTAEWGIEKLQVKTMKERNENDERD